MQVQVSPESSPSSSSARASVATAGTSPTSGDSDGIIHSVLCIYDFQSNDPVHLPFRKNDILDVVKLEDTGWWAAMRPGGDVIGWIPQAFVKPLSDEMTERLRNVREELRVYEYEAEQLYNSAPVETIPLYDSEPSPYRDSPFRETRKPYPPSPATAVPHPPSISAPINKPTPTTPNDREFVPQRYRSDSAPCQNPRRKGNGARLVTLNEGPRNQDVPFGSPDKKRLDKITRLTGSNDARVFHHAVQAQATSPWFLRPKYADQLQLDSDGQIRSGSIAALLEKLTSDTQTKDPISKLYFLHWLHEDRLIDVYRICTGYCISQCFLVNIPNIYYTGQAV